MTHIFKSFLYNMSVIQSHQMHDRSKSRVLTISTKNIKKKVPVHTVSLKYKKKYQSIHGLWTGRSPFKSISWNSEGHV